MAQTYRINFKIRRRGQAALDNHFYEFKSELYDDDESLCFAIASEILEELKSDREYLDSKEDDDDDDGDS